MSFLPFPRIPARVIPISPTTGHLPGRVFPINRTPGHPRGVPLPWTKGLIILLAILLQMVGAPLASAHVETRAQNSASHTVNSVPFHVKATDVQHLRSVIHNSQLAPTVKVLASSPTFIDQFPLVPSGIKALFPNATGLVTVVRGSHDDSTSDTVTLDVQNMPPNITFTIFLIELANKPFGNVEYVADLTTRGDGSGETIFRLISFLAFAMDARNPGSSLDGEGVTSGINLEHLGMWFSSLQDAQKVLNNDTLTGTIFDGGNPPLHAGPQAMTDGQTAPVL
ncbi:MAG: hypothetical protein NVSMB27_14310 [Ktedonobacteraceae bacterium]